MWGGRCRGCTRLVGLVNLLVVSVAMVACGSLAARPPVPQSARTLHLPANALTTGSSAPLVTSLSGRTPHLPANALTTKAAYMGSSNYHPFWVRLDALQYGVIAGTWSQVSYGTCADSDLDLIANLGIANHGNHSISIAVSPSRFFILDAVGRAYPPDACAGTPISGCIYWHITTGHPASVTPCGPKTAGTFVLPADSAVNLELLFATPRADWHRTDRLIIAPAHGASRWIALPFRPWGGSSPTATPLAVLKDTDTLFGALAEVVKGMQSGNLLTVSGDVSAAMMDLSKVNHDLARAPATRFDKLDLRFVHDTTAFLLGERAAVTAGRAHKLQREAAALTTADAQAQVVSVDETALITQLHLMNAAPSG